MDSHRVILVEAGTSTVDVLAARLRMQGYSVDVASGPAEGARLALADPPAAVVADLWMPGISGVQLCRLLRAEPATEHVPVILRGPLGSRDRFWAERAGASAYVQIGRMGELVRALAGAIASAPPRSDFFTELNGAHLDVRDRIAAHLDAALFESVVAAEVRALSMAGELDRLFDLFAQLLTRLTSYRWLALSCPQATRTWLHTHPTTRRAAEEEVRVAFGADESMKPLLVEDEDPSDEGAGPAAIVLDVPFGSDVIARLAIAPRAASESGDRSLADIVARELGGAIRMALLVEESHRLARVDPLTGLLNRRALMPAIEIEISRSVRTGAPLSVMLLDIDHFKSINDGFGHAMGDVVLARVGSLLASHARRTDLAARWGGEEFLVVLSGAGADGARTAAERVREALAALDLRHGTVRVPVTGSLGVATWEPGEPLDQLVERADRAMYDAKKSGRNRVVAAPAPSELSGEWALDARASAAGAV